MSAMRAGEVFALLLLVFTSTAQARQSDLSNWFDKQLIPYVTEQLTSHPRFKGETVQFVILREGNPEPLTSALALELLDQLRDATAELPEVTVGWKADPSAVRRSNKTTGIDCSASKVDYYIGLELSDGGQENLNVRLRALDIAERDWVAGFSKDWFGPLDHAQSRALHQQRHDPSFLGERDVPYSVDQTDLLASHIAHDLGCMLLSEMSLEYSIAPVTGNDTELPLDAIVELVSNNLSSYRALQITPDDDRANAVIEGKAHQIDHGLFQYWITVKPKDADENVPSISTSAYIQLPQQYIAAIVEPKIQEAIWKSDSSLLSSITVVGVDSYQQCNRGAYPDDRLVYGREESQGDAQCYALQVAADEDAVIFFVNQQPNHGLVRLADQNCESRTHARIARKDQPVRLNLPVDTVANVSWRPSAGWNMAPDADTYVAIAVSDTIAARAVGRHLQKLPLRCTGSLRLGLEGATLRAWTRDLIAIIENWQTHIDWESVRIKNVY